MLQVVRRSALRITRWNACGLALFTAAMLALPTLDWRAEGAPAEGPATSPPAAGEPDDREPRVEYLPRPSSQEAKILKALEEPTIEFNFVDAPLKDVIERLADAHEIPLVLDEKELKEGGILPEEPITASLGSIPLESALRAILEPLRATLLLHDDVLRVTSADAINPIFVDSDVPLITRTYPVGDLVDDAPVWRRLRPQWPGVPAMQEVLDGYGQLVEVIQETTPRTAWLSIDGRGGEIKAIRRTHSLEIKQTWPAHRDILELLRGLRAARQQRWFTL